MTIGHDQDHREFAWSLAFMNARAQLAVELLTRELTEEQLVRLAVGILMNELIAAQTDGDRMLKILAVLAGGDCDLMRYIGEAAWSWDINTGELLDCRYETLCAMVKAQMAGTHESKEDPIAPPPFRS